MNLTTASVKPYLQLRAAKRDAEPIQRNRELRVSPAATPEKTTTIERIATAPQA